MKEFDYHFIGIAPLCHLHLLQVVENLFCDYFMYSINRLSTFTLTGYKKNSFEYTRAVMRIFVSSKLNIS